MENQIYKTERKVTILGKNGSASATLKDLHLQHAGVLSSRGAKIDTELELIVELPYKGRFVKLGIDTLVKHSHISDNQIYHKLAFVELTHKQESILSDFLMYKQRLIDMGKRPTF